MCAMDTADRPDAAPGRGPCAAIPAEQMGFVRQILDRIGDKWSMLVITWVADHHGQIREHRAHTSTAP
jgi:hypothetical protein